MSTSLMISQSPAAAYVSQRGLKYGMKPFLRYVPTLMKALSDLYHPEENPNGYIITTLSECTQMAEELMIKLALRPLIPFSKLQLGDFNGSPELRNGIRQLIMREISSNIELSDSNIMCLNGATSVMTTAATALFNPGEALLIITPCYPCFFNDFAIPGDVHNVKVPLQHPEYSIDLEQLETCYQQSVKDGHQPRAIIIANPSNPTGIFHRKDELISLLRWARKKKLFYISSEVYATTCHGVLNESINEHKFVSIIDIAFEEAQQKAGNQESVDLSRVLGNDIQIIWSASKDLGLSGLRVGASICQNSLVHAAMSPYGISAQISRESQYTVALMLNDTKWITEFFKTMRQKLHQGSIHVEQTLQRLNIPFIKPYGGLFIWLDLSEFLLFYHYKNSIKNEAVGNRSPGEVSTTITESDDEAQTSIKQQPADAELNEAEWSIFEDIFYNYKLGITPGLDFAPSQRSIEVSESFMSSIGWNSISSTWLTSAGFMRLCFGAVPLPFIGLTMQRFENFVLDKRVEIQQIIDSSNSS